MSRNRTAVAPSAKTLRRTMMALSCLLLLLGCASAQDAATVPNLVKFSGTITAEPAGSTGVIFALYKDQSGGAPLWQEVQTVNFDASGHFTTLLGSTSATGIPLDVFSSGEARWLGVQVQGQAEQPRVLLVSVPYALKAADAQTLGGLPASAFVRLDTTSTASGAYVNTAAVTAAANQAVAAAINIGTATAGTLPVFTDSAGDLTNSAIAQSGGNVGIGTASPATTLNLVGTNPSMRIDNYSNITGDSPNFNFISGRGTVSAPLATQNGDNLGQFAAAGYNGSGFPGSKVKVTFQATENWTPTANGTAMSFQTTANGTTARTERMRIDNSGKVGIGTSAPGYPLSVNGTIQSMAGGFRFPDGSTQNTAATIGVQSITAADSSITVGGTATAPTVAVNTTTAVQKRVTGTCPTGEAVSTVNADGSVNCVAAGGGSGGGANESMYLNLFGDGSALSDVPGAVGARLHTDQAIAVTDVAYTANDSGVGPCTPALARVTNGTIYEDIPITVPTSSYNTADHAVVFPAGSDVSVVIAQTGYCGSNYPNRFPQTLAGSIRYRLANAGETTSCPPNLTLSNGSCIDTNSDALDCGSAGHVCPGTNQTTTCSNGVCGTGGCLPGYADCDGNPANGCETNTQNNASNCGYCGSTCPSTIPNGTAGGCSNSQCVYSCNAGYVACNYGGTLCANLQTDPNNCGACNNYCYPTVIGGHGSGTGVCTSGTCGYTCDAGYTLCASPYGGTPSCADFQSDQFNCGGCGVYCASGVCSAGQCQ